MVSIDTVARSADPPILFQDMYPSVSHVDVDGTPVFCSITLTFKGQLHLYCSAFI